MLIAILTLMIIIQEGDCQDINEISQQNNSNFNTYMLHNF